jgi:hypothetical protein
MTHLRVKPWMLLLTGCGLLWLPAPVHGSCGDHVTMRPSGAGNSQSMAKPHDSKDQHSDPVPSNRKDPHEKPGPGPGCSDNQPLPMGPMSVSTQQTNPEQAFALTGAIPTKGLAPAWLSSTVDILSPQLLAAFLFRPPRPGCTAIR